MPPIVSLVEVSHRYSTSWAIQNINIEITEKGVYGLLGSNGAGKSTTMNILCGVLNQTKGKVLIDGIDINKNPIEAKRLIGFLPQTPPLYLDLTVSEYLKYSAELRLVNKKQIHTKVEAVMEKCGLTHMRSRLIKFLSGGYRQRVGIAQAIIHNPKLVILDEPINGLDPVQIIEVRNLVKEIARNCTVILSSHILSEVQLICPQIIIVDHGNLIYYGSIEGINANNQANSLVVEFECLTAPDELKMFKGVTEVEKVNSKSFRLILDNNSSINEEIIETSVRKGWRLTQIAKEKATLDDIFKSLTIKKKEVL